MANLRMKGATTPLPHWLHVVHKERFFLYYEKLRFTIIHIPLKEIVKTGLTAGNEDILKVRWWERMVNCSSALGTVWSTLLTHPLREDVNEPSDVFLGANVMKFSYEKPHETYKGRTHLIWVAQWSIRVIRFKCLLSFCFGTGTEMGLRKQRSPTYIRPRSSGFMRNENWKGGV